jgi:hypothetical protein
VLTGSTPVAAEKRQAVMAIVDSLHYRPNVVAQGLARGRSWAVGVLIQDISPPYYGQFLQGIERGLRGFSLRRSERRRGAQEQRTDQEPALHFLSFSVRTGMKGESAFHFCSSFGSALASARLRLGLRLFGSFFGSA